MAIALTLDDITFTEMEIPERFGPIGGVQALAVHEFPGGKRTFQTFGPFPRPITWTGYLTGPNAMDRQQRIDRKRASGVLITLRWGRYAWLGVISEFVASPGHQWLIPYRITFEPIEDQSGISTQPTKGASTDQSLSTQKKNLSDMTDPTTRTVALPDDVNTAVDDLNADLDTANQESGGVVKNIPDADVDDIQAAATNVETKAAPYIAGTDATKAAPAYEAAASAKQSAILTKTPFVPQRKQTMINPNLYSVAGQYLDDPTRWKDITDASGLPPDPQPQGEHVIIIPAK